MAENYLIVSIGGIGSEAARHFEERVAKVLGRQHVQLLTMDTDHGAPVRRSADHLLLGFLEQRKYRRSWFWPSANQINGVFTKTPRNCRSYCSARARAHIQR